ncbi:Serine protease family s33, partial [Globisporangium splendens]
MSSSRRTPPPPLPETRSIDVDGKCTIKYIDIKPASHSPTSSPTIVLIHGSPGTFKDFRYLIPLLQENARVIGINLPGFGGSDVIEKEKYYDHVSALGEAEIAYSALSQTCKGEQNVFLVGHSFGGHTTINLAAMNLNGAKLNVRGVVFLASAGQRPHKAMWPVMSAVLSSVISCEIPVVSSAVQGLVRTIYTNFVGFPNSEPTSHYVTGLLRCNSTDFELVCAQLKEIAHIPAFIAYAKDDAHIQEEIFVKMSEECHPGPRFAFGKGGHNIQKTKAEFIAIELTKWIEDILS